MEKLFAAYVLPNKLFPGIEAKTPYIYEILCDCLELNLT